MRISSEKYKPTPIPKDLLANRQDWAYICSETGKQNCLTPIACLKCGGCRGTTGSIEERVAS